MIVVAVSSGTSVDAIDVATAALTLVDGAVHLVPLDHRSVPFSSGLRSRVLAALPPADTTIGEVCALDTDLGQELAAAARGAVERCARRWPGARPELVVSHGQTLFHWVEEGAVRGTLQLGQPAWIAEATGLPVVSDIRVGDVAAGGQGAPLASILDVLVLSERAGPAAALNLGGIANVTVVGAGDPVAFDTGPANALLDAAVRRGTDGRVHLDTDGALAARGTVHQGLLRTLAAHPYYALAPPKTTGKEVFHPASLVQVLEETGLADLPLPDLLATLVELTARTVAEALTPYRVHEVLVSGGGLHNPALMTRLARHLAPARLGSFAETGLDPDAKEAYLFALIGFLSWHGLPGTIPSCTGARRATVAGRFTPGPAGLRLPGPAAVAPNTLRVVDPTGWSPSP